MRADPTRARFEPDPPRQLDDGRWVVNRAGPAAPEPEDDGEPVNAWPFMLASGVGSLLLVLIGYAIGWYFGGRR